MRQAEIVAALREFARLLEATGESRFKIQAYERAAAALAQVASLESLIASGRLTELPGVGASIAAVVTELSERGSTATLDRLRSQVPPGFGDLVRAPHIGPKRAVALYQALGVRHLDDLEAAAREGRLAGTSGLTARHEAEILAALPEVRAASGQVLLGKALRAGEALVAWLAEAGPAALTGAARRGEEVVDAIEVVVADDLGRRVADYPNPPTSLGLAVRVHHAPRARFGNVLLETTGPASHVAALAGRGPLPSAPDEAALYEAVGVPFVPPEVRDHARLGEAHEDLVTLADLRGFVHCHTTWSDGRDTVLDMARAAEARGARYLTITDHSPAAPYAGGLDYDRIRRQWDEIDWAQGHVGVTLLKGTESDILADGSLDWPDHVLEQLDVVIASVHQRHKLDRAQATERLVRAMSLPIFKIWGHALGRLLLDRPPMDVDVDAVLDAAVGRAAIEINADPRRLDLPPEHVRAARARGLPFVISVDAHSIAGLDEARFGVLMARRGGVRRHEVLNTLEVDAFRGAVQPA